MSNATKVVAELGDGTIVRLQARDHVWNADEPIEVRGTDQAPNPYEMLLGALGACTTLTLRFYASHKGWPLRSPGGGGPGRLLPRLRSPLRAPVQ